MTFWIVVHQLYFWIYKQNIWGMVTYSIIWKIVIVLLFLMRLYQLGYGASLVAQWKWSESLSVVSDSLRPHGLWILQARILEWVASPNPGIEPRSPVLQADSLPAEPQGSPRILEWVAIPFLTQGSNPDLLHCRWVLDQSVWVSLIAQLVKNLLAMQETPGWFLGWEDPLEKG